VRLVGLLLRFTKVVHVLFQILPLFLELASQVAVVLVFLFELFLDVDLVKTHDLLLQLFVIANLVQTVMNVVFELFNFAFLLFENRSQFPLFENETLLPHSEIFNNQTQVVVHALKVLFFLFHLVGLFLEFFDLLSPRSNVCSKLFDLVVKYELEFFKLLGFLFQIVNAFVFVANGVLTFCQFQFLRLNV
jgi:hypothetical protein